MARPINEQLRTYFEQKRAELQGENARRAARGERPMRDYVVQFVCDGETGQIYCATRFIRPNRVQADLADAQADLARLVEEHVSLEG